MATPEQPPAAPSLLNARAAAERLGVDERTIRRAIARGELPAVKRAGAFQIARPDLERYQRGRARPGGVANVEEPTSPRQPAFSPSGPPAAAHGALPVPLTSLVGREREIASLAALLRGPDRHVTLTGPGGVGKTRLAVAAASAVAAEFRDGVCFFALAAIDDPRLVASAIAHILGVHQSGAGSLTDHLVAALRQRRLLLLLDNFEQVVEAAPLLASLLAACPHLTLLVTSRVRLRLSGECERAVLPLEVGTEDGGRGTEERLIFPSPVLRPPSSPAVTLFVERARTVVADFTLTEENAADVAAICQRLDGLPLAIELAAARVKVLPPAALLSRLDHAGGSRLPLLAGGPRDMPPRLQTMRDAIAWSYDLLSDAEQSSFRRLAVFVGGFTLEAAESVRGIGGKGDGGEVALSPSPPIPLSPSTLDLVASLVDKSLLRVEEAVAGEPRYGMLETIREFGLEQLAANGETPPSSGGGLGGEEESVRQRHAEWALAFAEDAGPRAKQAAASAWLLLLETEHPNLRSALGWFLERGDGPRLLRMAASLWPFWQEHNHAGEGLRWLELALDLGGEAPPADRLRALSGAGTLAWYLTRVEQALAWHEQALALARATGDRVAEAFALGNLSWQAVEQGDLDGAIASCETSLALARAAGATEAMTLALHNLACFTRMGGDLVTASRHAAEALALARAEGWDWLAPMILVGFGFTAVELGEIERAAALFREGLQLGFARGDLVDVSTALEGLARVAVAGQAEQATRLYGAVEALRDEIAMPYAPSERSYIVPILAALQGDLGAERYAAAWAAGRSLPRDEAIAEALALSSVRTKPSPSTATSTRRRLTDRELEVLRLLAEGQSNRAIAEALVVSPTTVASHVANIFAKLEVESRAQAIAYAHRHELA